MQKTKLVAITAIILLLIGGTLAILPKVRERQLKAELSKSIRQSQYQMFARLVQSDGFSRLPSRDRQAVILEACTFGRLDIVKLLKERGWELNFMDGDGKTPLLYAAYSSSPELVAYLLGLGADVNHHDRVGNDALSNAVWAKRPESLEIAVILLDSGAIPYRGEANPQPLQSAVRIGNTNIIALLLSRMTNTVFTESEQQTIIEWTEQAQETAMLSRFLSEFAPSPAFSGEELNSDLNFPGIAREMDSCYFAGFASFARLSPRVPDYLD